MTAEVNEIIQEHRIPVFLTSAFDVSVIDVISYEDGESKSAQHNLRDGEWDMPIGVNTNRQN